MLEKASILRVLTIGFSIGSYSKNMFAIQQKVATDEWLRKESKDLTFSFGLFFSLSVLLFILFVMFHYLRWNPSRGSFHLTCSDKTLFRWIVCKISKSTHFIITFLSPFSLMGLFLFEVQQKGCSGAVFLDTAL